MPVYNEFVHITIDDARIDETCNAYFKWKDLNTYIVMYRICKNILDTKLDV
ncbi:MAG: hypothetical protein J5525_00680 [Lachnospiraceae bacterium]|nr:hypothetical protein [Lachnospiraceae bacterium]